MTHTGDRDPAQQHPVHGLEHGTTTPTGQQTVVDLDGIVAIATITASVIGRPLTPGESSRLKTAWTQAHPRTLPAIADQAQALTAP